MDKFFVFEAFSKNGHANQFPTIDIPVVNDCCSLRQYQRDAFQQLHGQPRIILTCPTGWGKTKLLQFLAVYALSTTGHKVLVTVPQRIIARGFAADCVLDIDGTKHNWGSIYNCCTRIDGRNVKMISQFLESEAVTNEGRICITTHSALVRLFSENPSLLLDKQFIMVVDECHHISLSGENDEIGNKLGQVINTILPTQSWLWLTSATFGRADYGEIVSEDYIDKFAACNVTFDEYWETLKHLCEFKHRYVFYDGGHFPRAKRFESAIDNIPTKIAESQKECQSCLETFEMVSDSRRTLVYVPQANSRFLFGGDKRPLVDDIIDILSRKVPDAYDWSSRCRRPHAIIDLTRGEIDAKIEFLYNHGDKVYAVIACSMMREGADWPMLEHIIDLAPVFSSMPLRIQKFGRGTRDYIGKRSFVYTTVLPRLFGDDTEHATRCNEYFNYLVMSLVDSMFYSPSKFWPTNHIPKIAQMQKLAEGVFETIVAIGESAEDGSSMVGQLEEALDDCCGGTVDSTNIVRYLREQAKSIVSQLHTELGFEKVKEDDIVGAYRSYCTEVCGSATFKEMRHKLANSESIAWLKMFHLLKSRISQQHGHELLLPR